MARDDVAPRVANGSTTVMTPKDAAITAQRHFRGYRTRVQVMKMATTIKIHTGTAGRMSVIHAIRVLGTSCTERTPLETAMLTDLFLKLESSAFTRDLKDYDTNDSTVKKSDAGFFTTKDAVERERILDCMELVSVEAGNVLFEEGDVSNGNFYFVIGGQVQVRISDERGPLLPPKMLKLMSNGCSFGDRVHTPTRKPLNFLYTADLWCERTWIHSRRWYHIRIHSRMSGSWIHSRSRSRSWSRR